MPPGLLIPRRTVLAGGAAFFPGAAVAAGWTSTKGGDGGRTLRVTTLAPDGPGSLKAALDAGGPRTVVFAVAGVIDLSRTVLKVTRPHVTVAGETAPSPGITLIRGGLTVSTHDVVLRHIRVRPGEARAAKGSGWECDAISVYRGHDVVVDHCSCSWATDENLSASGPRFDGAGPDAWRAATSHRITFTNNIVAEGLSRSTHAKGEHSKGGLIHDNVTGVLVGGNLYAHNRERNPLFKGGAQGAVVNNLIYDPGRRAIHANLHAAEWDGHPHEAVRMSVVGNVLRAGPSSPPDLALMMVGGDGPVELHMSDNLAFDAAGRPARLLGGYGASKVEPTMSARPVAWPPGLAAAPAAGVEAAVLAQAGARPWDRDAVDRRIVEQVRTRTGRVIDSETDVGGYPAWSGGAPSTAA